MEKVADTIMFPCKYQTNGCHVNLIHKHKLEHEDGCDFRPVGSSSLRETDVSIFIFLLSSTCVPVQAPRASGKEV